MAFKFPEHARAYYAAWYAAHREEQSTKKKVRYAANRAAASRKAHAWYEANKARHAAKAKEYRETHDAEIKAWKANHYLDNREQILAEQRQKRLENHDAWKGQRRAQYAIKREEVSAYRAQHREHLREREKAWRDAHPEIARAKYLRRHARRRGAPIRDLTAAQWQAIKDHFGHCCVYCGRHMQRLTQDHIIPLSKGGSHTMPNIVPACQSCNSRKGNREVVCPVEPLLRLPDA